jgi:NAD(P)-dependent dehydrogenase (short-subunit alcohol dehydrogenase family)
MLSLAGRAAIVTGAGRGIGRGHALALAAAGASVVVNDVGCEVDGRGADRAIADSVVAEIRAAGGRATTSYEPVGTPAAAGALVRTALDAFGRLDVLVNNAGIVSSHPLTEFPDDAWERTLAVHLTGTFACTRAAFLAMREAGRGGRIVNTTSGAGIATGYPGSAAYAASKGGIAALTRVTATDGAPLGITCNAIAPLAHTRMSGSFLAGKSSGGEGDVPAALIVYLASEASATVTGQIFRVAEGRIGIVRAAMPAGLASS